MNKFLKMAAAALFAAFLVLPGMSRADATAFDEPLRFKDF